MRVVALQRSVEVACHHSFLKQTLKNWRPLLRRRNFSSLEVTEIVGDDAPMTKMNLFTAINDAMRIAMKTDDSVILFGEDVAFGGVFRCSVGLREEFGPDRVFNTPLSEQGIAGFGVGYAAMGKKCIAEIQFADYIFPAFDQLVNEAAKFRYRSGGQFAAGGLTVRAPAAAVGHGGHYHSQSPESYFCHTPGLRVVMPSTPADAKGLLLAAVRSPDPVVFFEPKALYRAAIEEVPDGDYEIPLGKGVVRREGSDVTLVGWGTQMRELEKAANMAADVGISCEVIDLRSLLPWDADLVEQSVMKTGRLVVSHEATKTGGFGAEIASEIAERCFFYLEAPVQRAAGYDMPCPLIYEKLYLPLAPRIFEKIKQAVGF